MPVLDREWIQTHRETASRGMKEAGFTAYMEASFGIAAPKPDHSASQLLNAASDAAIQTFGWPIGVVLQDEFRPQPTSDGIVAEVSLDGVPEASHYDYWTLRRNGDFFLRKSLFEDQRNATAIFFNTRIVRNTELLLYAVRLYDRLGVDPSTRFVLDLQYGGLSGRVLGSSSPNRILSSSYPCSEDEIRRRYDGSLQEVEGSLIEVVKQLTAPLLALFDLFEVADSTYQQIVEAYVEGHVT